MERFKEKESVPKKARELFRVDQSKNQENVRGLNERINNKFDAKSRDGSERFEGTNNPFARETERVDKGEEIKLNDNTSYIYGIHNVHLREDTNRGYSFDLDVSDENWLRNSVNDRIEKQTGINYKIYPRSKSNTYRLYGNNKNLVKEWKYYQQNPDKIREATPQQQDNWLAASFDSKGTFGLKEINVSFNNPSIDKPVVMKDLLELRGIDSNINKPDNRNPHLTIQGLDNFKAFKEKIPIEKKSSKEKLDKSINYQEKLNEQERIGYKLHPEKTPIKYFEGGDRFEDVQNRNDAGDALEVKVGQSLRYTRPNSIRIELVKAKNYKGKGIKPDYVVKHPDGKIEAIEVKLNLKDFGSKDKDYNSNSKIDFTTGVYLEGKDKETKKTHGKDFNYESIDSWIKDLEKAKENPKFKSETKEIDKLIKDFKNLAKKAKEVKGRNRASSNDKSYVSKDTTTKEAKYTGSQSEDKPKNGKGDKEEEGGGGGKEYKQVKPSDNYQQGDDIFGSKEGGKRLDK